MRDYLPHASLWTSQLLLNGYSQLSVPFLGPSDRLPGPTAPTFWTSNFTHAYALQAHQRDLLLAVLFKVGSRGSASWQRVGIVNDNTRLHTHTRGRLGGD